MALTKLKGNLERILDKNLADLVRGIRNNKENEVCVFVCQSSYCLSIHMSNWLSIWFKQVKYIAQCIEEIKAELKQENIAVKANAVAKLSYASPLSTYNFSWNSVN